MTGADTLGIYQQFGIAGVFLVMYTTTIWFLIRMLVRDKAAVIQSWERERERVEEIARIIQENTECKRQMIQVMKELEAAVRKDAEAQNQLFIYLRAKNHFGAGDP